MFPPIPNSNPELSGATEESISHPILDQKSELVLHEFPDILLSPAGKQIQAIHIRPPRQDFSGGEALRAVTHVARDVRQVFVVWMTRLAR